MDNKDTFWKIANLEDELLIYTRLLDRYMAPLKKYVIGTEAVLFIILLVVVIPNVFVLKTFAENPIAIIITLSIVLCMITMVLEFIHEYRKLGKTLYNVKVYESDITKIDRIHTDVEDNLYVECAGFWAKEELSDNKFEENDTCILIQLGSKEMYEPDNPKHRYAVTKEWFNPKKGDRKIKRKNFKYVFKEFVLSRTAKFILITSLEVAIATFAGYFIYVPCNSLPRKSDAVNVNYTDFMKDLELNQIETAYYTDNSKYLYFTLIGDYKDIKTIFYTSNPMQDDLVTTMVTHNILVNSVEDLNFAEYEETNRTVYMWLLIIVAVGVQIYTYHKESEQEGNDTLALQKPISTLSGTGGELKISKPQSNKKNRTGKTFDDIAGLKEVKKDMQSLVDFLVNKDKYIEAGAKLPKGVILYGPPGTGKTLLAKAIANEANTSFISMNGSEFIEMYVGVGAKRVRELFDSARRQAPCIIFIDEIDAIGGKRTGNESNSEDRKTLNALLTEMDGFNEMDNILVIGATNRIEDLDPALLREGRFTNKYCVPLPETANERREIIDIYVKNKKLAEDVDLKALAKETIGFSPAKIESLLNESAIISVQSGSRFIRKEHIDKAMYKMLLHGHQKDDQTGRDIDELTTVAWHEAGHALTGKLIGKEVTKVTILSSTSGAGGVTFSTPIKRGLYNIEDLKNQVIELYGGREAERILYKDDTKVTTGASNDIERATEVINDMITKYGMIDKFGLITLSGDSIDKKSILDEKIRISKELQKDTYDMLDMHYDKLKQIAELLLEKETIYENDLDDILNL